ncbi:MAG: AAA family ATPase [Pseudomonadota bacterium]
MLAKWLAAAELDHLLAKFVAQQIEYGDLADLTDAELRELGLTIGERKRFRRALATSVASVVSGERRPLTLAFFDLIDSSALCEKLDTEDMVELLRSYRELCCSAIDRYGGHVAHLMGDGVLAYFCYPVAHENDAERAVRAAVEITETVGQLQTPAERPLAVRSGIATGRVVVTELFSGRAADKHAVTGSTANLAARLQMLAPPNGVVLSEATGRRVGHIFDCEDLGPRTLQGFREPVTAFRVQSELPQPRSPDQLRQDTLTPFIDREYERDALYRYWQETEQGRGRTVSIHGEPGIGKSRLVSQVLRSFGTGSRVVRLHASAFDEHSPLRPFLGYLRSRLQLPVDANQAELAEALRQLLPAEDLAIEALAGFLSHDVAIVEGALTAASERRNLALQALSAHFVASAEDGPLSLVIEDAHWLDATSKDLLGRIIGRAPQSALLIIVTSRSGIARVLPEIDPALVTEIGLGPLSAQEVQAMVCSTFGDEPVPQEVVARIAMRTDGVPLFVEELLRPLLSSSLPANWGSLIAEEARPSAVPATLHEALTARFDRLKEAKEVAQVAAVLGRSINRHVLAQVMGQPVERLMPRLETLVSAGVLSHEPEAPADRYIFTHALVRDAAYDSLLRDQRHRLHVTVAETLLGSSPGFAAERPDIVARHLTEGGRPVEALPHWLGAGRAAAARSALHEAKHVLETGAGIAAQLPQTPEMVQTRLEFASLLGPVLFALCGPGSKESREVYETAVSLTEAMPASGPYFAVLWGWWRLSKDFRVKAERARSLLRLANRRREPEMVLQAHHCNWASTFHAGDFDGCRWHVEQGLKTYAQPDCENRPWLFGNHDAKVCGHGELAQVLWMQGEPAAALAEEARALDWSTRLAHAGTQAHAYDLTLLHRFYRRDVTETRKFAEKMIGLAEDLGMAENRARGHLFLGWSLALQGDAEAGLKVFQGGYDRQRAVGTKEDTPIYVCMFAEILGLMGAPDRALTELEEVRGELERQGICNWAPEIWRMIAEMTLQSDAQRTGEAERAYRNAAAIAASQGVAMLELRATASQLERAPAGSRPDRITRLRDLRSSIAERASCFDLTEADRLLRKAGDTP